MNKHTFHLKREREEKHFIDEIKRRKKRVQMQERGSKSQL
jgi:hypothetical protein